MSISNMSNISPNYIDSVSDVIHKRELNSMVRFSGWISKDSLTDCTMYSCITVNDHNVDDVTIYVYTDSKCIDEYRDILDEKERCWNLLETKTDEEYDSVNIVVCGILDTQYKPDPNDPNEILSEQGGYRCVVNRLIMIESEFYDMFPELVNVDGQVR
jgi:hypothetical protein